MDRYDPYTDKFLRDTQYDILSMNLAQLGTDCISRAAAIDALDEQIEQCDKALSSFDISMRDEFAVKAERASLVAFRETLEYLPPAQPDNSLQKLADEIAKYKRTMRSSNSDYFTGYMSALSMVEGMIADMMPHEPYEGVRE